MYDKDTLSTAITAAVTATLDALQDSDEFRTVSAEQLIQWSELDPPTDQDNITVHRSWSLNLMTLREQWREQVLDKTGRFPRTIHGYGF